MEAATGAPIDVSTSPHLARIGMVLEDLQNIVSDTSQKLVGKRANLSPWLGIAIIIVVIASLFIGVVYMGSRGCVAPLSDEHQAIVDAGSACLTTPCLETAAYMLESMDPKADPCVDFYQYACGGWVNNTGAPPERERIDVADKLTHDNEAKWRRILESRVSRGAGTDSAEWKLKTFFKMCIHDYGRQKDGGSKLVDAIQNDLKGWYVLDPDNWSQRWTLNDALEVIHAKYLVKVLFSYGVWPDLRDHKKNIITIYPSWSGLYSSYYEREDKEHVRQKYKEYIRTLGGLVLRDANLTLAENETNARLDQFVTDVFEQEKKLAKFKINSGDFNWYSPTYAKLGDLHRNFTQIDWEDIFERLFEHAGVTRSTEIEVVKLDYFQAVDQMLKGESAERDRMMNNYITWTMIKRSAYYLSWDYRHAMFNFYEEAYGYTEMPSTWDQCIRIIKRRMPLILAVLFVDTHVNLTATQHVKEIGEVVRKQGKLSAQKIDWMDPTTKANAAYKLDQMEIDAGMPPDLVDRRSVDLNYVRLRVDKTQSFFENVLNINTYVLYQMNRDYHTGYKDQLWRWAVYWKGFGSRLWYWYWFNMALVPPGAMLQPMYDQGAPAPVNYGCLGQYFGSSTIQAINRWGRWFINDTLTTWWTDDDYKKYQDKEKCYLNYYKNQTAGPYLVEGERKTVSMENAYLPWDLIPETEGLTTAYRGMKEYLRNYTVKPLPGLRLSHEQTFFLAAAQTYCYAEHPRDEYRDAQRGQPPTNMIINGMMSMTPEFSEAYKCPATSAYKTGPKCRIF